MYKIAHKTKCRTIEKDRWKRKEYIKESRTEDTKEVIKKHLAYKGHKSKLQKTRNDYKVPNTLGGRRFNRKYFTLPSRKYMGQIQLTGLKV